MNYIIYKTTNTLNGMFYVGCHQTNDLNDGYLGSGKHLRRAIKKYGAEYFKFEILHLLDSKEEMFKLERYIVNESLVQDPKSYNLKLGGSGGNPGIVGAFSGRKHTDESKEKIRQAAMKQVISEQTRQKLSMNSAMKNNPEVRKKVSITMTGRTCSSEHCRRVAEANLGKILINNGKIAKRISKNELSYFEKLGWNQGGMPRNKKESQV